VISSAWGPLSCDTNKAAGCTDACLRGALDPIATQEATLRGETDKLTTPASRIVMGRSVELGTGCMDLTQRLDTLGLDS